MTTAGLQALDGRRDGMVQITIEVPEALAERLAAVQERLPEVLAYGLEVLSPLPNEVYRALLDFVTSNPAPEAVLHFRPTPQMQERISALLDKNRHRQLTPVEAAELDEYERINRFVRKLKIRAVKALQAPRNVTDRYPCLALLCPRACPGTLRVLSPP
jgi:hypothetical protein